MQNFQNCALVSIDLETLGVRKYTSKIVQIGIASTIMSLGIPSKIETCSYPVITSYSDLHPEIRDKFTTEKDTLEFWEGQPSDLKNTVFAGEFSITVALENLSKKINELATVEMWPNEPIGIRNVWVWVNGLDFDIPILKHHYDMIFNSDPAWVYNRVRDVRTRTDFPKFRKFNRGSFGTGKHDAEFDAYHQLVDVIETITPLEAWNAPEGWSRLKKNG